MTWRLSIRTQLVLGVAVLYALLVGAFVLNFIERQRAFLHHEQAGDALSLIKGIARAGAGAMLAGDVAGMQEVLAAVTDMPGLVYGFVVDDDGRVIAHTDRALVGKYVSDPTSLRLPAMAPEARVLVETSSLIDAAAPVVVQGRPVGWVRIALGKERMRQALADIVRYSLGFAAIAIAVGAGFAAWAGRRLTRGLYGLMQVAEATRDGERGRRAEVSGKDEIGVLARAFNAMLDRLTDGEASLRRLNEDLDQRVRERTEAATAANEEVRKSEVLFRGLLESSADAVVLVDDHGEIILINAECSKVFGYDRHDLIGRPVEILIPGRFHHAGLREAYSRKPTIRPMGVGLHVLGRRKDGSEFPAEVRLSPLQTEDGLIISAVVRDVTERQQAEDRLRDSERRYRLLLENLPHRIFSKDHKSVFRAVNPAFASWFGRTPEEVVGLTDYDLQPPARASHVQDLDRLVLVTGMPTEFDEELSKDGDTRIFHTIKAPVREDDGSVVGLLGISWDITDRKRAEIALTEATRAAEAASRFKSDFLANMSHEIRTPMNAVIGLAHLLAQTPLTARQQDYLGKIRSSANALLALLNDILDLSKVEAGKLELEAQPFRLDTLMRDLATILSANTQHKDIEILFNVDPAVPPDLVGDALRLNQVLINLAGNAIKFTERGEVVVSVTPVTLTPERAELRFSIRDTGIGITAEQKERLFQAFNQGDSSTSRRFGGTGLGLAISGRLARLMGGELAVDSEPERGSDFHFTARFGRPAAPVAAKASSSSPPLGHDLRVLVVDDNPTAREVMDNLVSSLGWRADVVASGEEALALYRDAEPPYDLVLLDWKMPGMDGLEVSRRLHAMADRPPPVVIVVTAYGRDLVARETSDVNALLVKPVTASMLFDKVVDVLGGGADRPAAVREPGRRPLAGLRLLVAEDNAINQQVASEMLTQAGAIVVLAGNGVEAVALFREQGVSFDAVLMDIQMPEMDGYAATAALRALPGGDIVPVIAMTANAMASDRERCLAAGMNDHVAKPLMPDVLTRTICLWTLGETAETTETAYLDEVPETLHIPGIDAAGALWRLGGDEDALRRLLTAFARQLPASVAACAAAIVSGDRAAAEAAAHAVKGAAGNVGAMSLSGIAAGIEAVARDGAETPSLDQLEDLQHAATDLVGAIARAFADWSAAEAAPAQVDPVRLRATLDELARLLADDNFAAVETFEAVRFDLAAVAGADAVAALAAAVEVLDFAAAQRLLADIKVEGTAA